MGPTRDGAGRARPLEPRRPGDAPHGPRFEGDGPRLLFRQEPQRLEEPLARGGGGGRRRGTPQHGRQLLFSTRVPGRQAEAEGPAIPRAGDCPLPLLGLSGEQGVRQTGNEDCRRGAVGGGAAAARDRLGLTAGSLPQPGRRPRGAVDLGRRGRPGSAAAQGGGLSQAHPGLLPREHGGHKMPRGCPDGGRQTQPAPLRGHLRPEVQRVFRKGLAKRRRLRLQRCSASRLRLPPSGARDVADTGRAALPADQLRRDAEADSRSLPRDGHEARLRGGAARRWAS